MVQSLVKEVEVTSGVMLEALLGLLIAVLLELFHVFVINPI